MNVQSWYNYLLLSVLKRNFGCNKVQTVLFDTKFPLITKSRLIAAPYEEIQKTSLSIYACILACSVVTYHVSCSCRIWSGRNASTNRPDHIPFVMSGNRKERFVESLSTGKVPSIEMNRGRKKESTFVLILVQKYRSVYKMCSLFYPLSAETKF